MSFSLQVLSILQPKSNLHILAEDDDVFWDLPLSVQQQVPSWAVQQNQEILLQLKHRSS
jgi:hypothetical protein